jgi:hypothetical protein
LHILQLALGKRELFTLRGQLSLEHGDAFAMLGGEAFGDCNGFVILDLAREPAAPLRIRKALAFQCQFSVGPGDGFVDFADGNLGVDDGFTHLARERAQVGRTCGRIQGSAERVPQALEQGPPCFLAQLFRIVFAKNGERTGSTERDEHLGHTGRREPCWAIDSVRAKCSSHFVQRYS